MNTSPSYENFGIINLNVVVIIFMLVKEIKTLLLDTKNIFLK